jgi:hypothetical protein
LRTVGSTRRAWGARRTGGYVAFAVELAFQGAEEARISWGYREEAMASRIRSIWEARFVADEHVDVSERMLMQVSGRQLDAIESDREFQRRTERITRRIER